MGSIFLMKTVFSTQIYQSKLSFDLPDLIKEISQIQQADKAGLIWSKENYKNGYTSYGSWDQMQKMSSTFTKLEKKLDLHVRKFIKNLEYDIDMKQLKMNSCWVNVMPAGAFHTAHIHPHSIISGTFYVAVPDRASCIRFEDPRLGFFMNAPTVKKNAKLQNQRFVQVQPKAGELILFESWLRHEVPLNQSQKPRISVSFNYG